MITVTTNIDTVLLNLVKEVSFFGPGEPRFETVLTGVAEGALEEVKNRIHSDGKAADGSDIGKYAGNSKKGKVTLNASGTLGNRLTVLLTEKGAGLGWEEEELAQRAAGIETRYGKKIWALTEEEEQHATKVAQIFTRYAFS